MEFWEWLRRQVRNAQFLVFGLTILLTPISASACRYLMPPIDRTEAAEIIRAAELIFEGRVVRQNSSIAASVRVTSGLKGIKTGSTVEIDGQAGSCSLFLPVGMSVRIVGSWSPSRKISMNEDDFAAGNRLWDFPDLLNELRTDK